MTEPDCNSFPFVLKLSQAGPIPSNHIEASFWRPISIGEPVVCSGVRPLTPPHVNWSEACHPNARATATRPTWCLETFIQFLGGHPYSPLNGESRSYIWSFPDDSHACWFQNNQPWWPISWNQYEHDATWTPFSPSISAVFHGRFCSTAPRKVRQLMYKSVMKEEAVQSKGEMVNEIVPRAVAPCPSWKFMGPWVQCWDTHPQRCTMVHTCIQTCMHAYMCTHMYI